MNTTSTLEHGSVQHQDVAVRLDEVERALRLDQPLSRYDIAFYSQYRLDRSRHSQHYTAIGVNQETLLPFVEVVVAQNPVDALIQAEDQHHEAAVHMVFYGQIDNLKYRGD